MSLQVDPFLTVTSTNDAELLPIPKPSQAVDDLLPVSPHDGGETPLLPVEKKDRYRLMTSTNSFCPSGGGLKPATYYIQGPRLTAPENAENPQECFPQSKCDFENRAFKLAEAFQQKLSALGVIDSNTALNGPEELVEARDHYRQAQEIYQEYLALSAEYKNVAGVSPEDVKKLDLALDCDDYKTLQLKMESICRGMRETLGDGLKMIAGNFANSHLEHPLDYLRRVDSYIENLNFIADHLGYGIEAKQELEAALAEQKVMALRSLHQNFDRLKKETFSIARGIHRHKGSEIKDFDTTIEYLEAFEQVAQGIPEARKDFESGYFVDKIMFDVARRAYPKILNALKKYTNQAKLTSQDLEELGQYTHRALIIKKYLGQEEQARIENYLSLLQRPSLEGDRMAWVAR